VVSNPEEIICTKVTKYEVDITLANGVVLHVSSLSEGFHFSLSNIEQYTEWGLHPDHLHVFANTQKCSYIPRNQC